MSTKEITSGRFFLKCRDNCFYCLPFYAKQLPKVNPFNDETILVGKEYEGGGKWCNGFLHGDLIYGIPFQANKFLKYNIKTEISEIVGDDFDYRFKLISGAVVSDDCLYCFPFIAIEFINSIQMMIQQYLLVKRSKVIVKLAKL